MQFIGEFTSIVCGLLAIYKYSKCSTQIDELYFLIIVLNYSLYINHNNLWLIRHFI